MVQKCGILRKILNDLLRKDYNMKLIKEYKENGITIKRYEMAKPKKKVVIKGKPRKPSYGWKAPK